VAAELALQCLAGDRHDQTHCQDGLVQTVDLMQDLQ
jgi:hypothetical protein